MQSPESRVQALARQCSAPNLLQNGVAIPHILAMMIGMIVERTENRVLLPGGTERSQRGLHGGILVLAFLLRLAVIASVLRTNPGAWPLNPVGELGFIAKSLLAGHGISSPFGGATGPTAFLAPGYPALVAGIFALFGEFTATSAAVVMVVQALFSVLAIFLIMKVAEREFGAMAANCCGVYWAVGLPYVWLPAMFWDTSITVLFVISSIALALSCSHKPTKTRWALMGVVGGCALLVNPSLVLVLAAVFGWTVVQTRGRWHAGPLLSVLVLLAVFGWWPVRNARVLHAFIPLRSNFGFELWKGNRPGATAIDTATVYPVFDRGEYDSYAAKGEVAFMRDKAAVAKQYIFSHPRWFLRLTMERFALYWMGAGGGVPVLASFSILTTLLGIAGLAFLLNDGRIPLGILLVLPLLLFPLPYYITHVEVRFRIAMEPITTLLSAYAVVRLTAMLQRRQRERAPAN